MGQVLAEIPDERAGVMLAFAAVLGVLGIALLGAELAARLHEFLWVLGAFAVFFGVVFFAVGSVRKNRRLLVCREGLIQVWGERAEPLLWRDVDEVLLQQERRYHNLGVYQTNATCCSLRRRDGAWVEITAVPVTPRVIKALRQGWEQAQRGWEK
jgi:hypothetical protein